MTDAPRNRHEITMAEIVQMVGRPDPVIIEIGCNDGTDTLRFLEAFPDFHARVFAFEPDPRPIRRWKVDDRRCKLCRMAVSDEDGETEFWQSDGTPPAQYCRHDTPCRDGGWDLSGSLCRPTGHLSYSPWVTFNQKTPVETVRLDTWLAQHEPLPVIDFIWADTQGAEAKVIAGAPLTLRRTRFLYTEFYNRPMYEGQPNLDSICAMLPDFDLVAIYARENALFRRKADAA